MLRSRSCLQESLRIGPSLPLWSPTFGLVVHSSALSITNPCISKLFVATPQLNLAFDWFLCNLLFASYLPVLDGWFRALANGDLCKYQPVPFAVLKLHSKLTPHVTRSMQCGMVVVCVGIGLLSLFDVNSSWSLIYGITCLCGVGKCVCAFKSWDEYMVF